MLLKKVRVDSLYLSVPHTHICRVIMTGEFVKPENKMGVELVGHDWPYRGCEEKSDHCSVGVIMRGW